MFGMQRFRESPGKRRKHHQPFDITDDFSTGQHIMSAKRQHMFFLVHIANGAYAREKTALAAGCIAKRFEQCKAQCARSPAGGKVDRRISEDLRFLDGK